MRGIGHGSAQVHQRPDARKQLVRVGQLGREIVYLPLGCGLRQPGLARPSQGAGNTARSPPWRCGRSAACPGAAAHAAAELVEAGQTVVVGLGGIRPAASSMSAGAMIVQANRLSICGNPLKTRPTRARSRQEYSRVENIAISARERPRGPLVGRPGLIRRARELANQVSGGRRFVDAADSQVVRRRPHRLHPRHVVQHSRRSDHRS